MLIARTSELGLLQQWFKTYPVVAILGPRQCGKTTLSRQFSATWPEDKVTVFDLENPRDIERLEDPLTALEDLKGLVIIDEIQKRPELFPVLRVLADRKKAKYLILGSASRDLIRQSSETLAGRIHYMEIGGFALEHIPTNQVEKLWVRGGFPKSFLAPQEKASFQWRQDFIVTFLERDIPNLGFQIPARSLHRFWSMLAHYHGQIFNASEIGQSLGVSDHTAQRYLDLLSGTFIVRQLRPWFYLTKKRLIKRPKIYFRDSGILHALLSLESKKDILSHPKLGSSWEGFALEETIRRLDLRETEVFFWGTHTGAELDFVFEKKGKLYGVKIKYTKAPSLTPSMRAALEELSLAHLWVVYPGTSDYPLHPKVSVSSIQSSLKI